MTNRIGLMLATAFMASALSSSVKVNVNWLDMQDKETSSESKFQRQLILEADEYLSQLIIQNRYITANAIVWVYGCADKS